MKIAIAIVHGIGSQTPGFSQSLQESLVDYYKSFGAEFKTSDLIFKEVYWADVLQNQQQQLFEKINYKDDLRFVETRKFLIHYLGDAVAYQPLSNNHDPDQINVYKLVHERIDHVLEDFAKHPNIDPNSTPLVFMGHSLGTVILSNYIWDMQQQHDNNKLSKLQQCGTLAGLLTFGSPIALWSLRYKSFGNPINFPGKDLSDPLKDKARWYNFYDRDDVIACPLREINSSYSQVVSQDIEINVGNILSSWNPLSHAGYWDDKDMIEPIAGFLRDLKS